MDIKYDSAVDLSLSEASEDRRRGRKQLERLMSVDGIDCNYCLGRSYEKDKDYEAASRAYNDGLKLGHRASIYRLVLLHRERLLKKNDRDFVLRTVKLLADEGHIPSKALYLRERISGSYGLVSRLIGIAAFLPVMLQSLLQALRNPESWRMDM